MTSDIILKYVSIKDIGDIARLFLTYPNATDLENHFFLYIAKATLNHWVLPVSVAPIDSGNVIGILFCYRIGETHFSIVISDTLDLNRQPKNMCVINVTTFNKNKDGELVISHMLPIHRKYLLGNNI